MISGNPPGKGIGEFVAQARARIREIDPDTLAEWRITEPDLLIVDVREADEYVTGHIPDSILIPRGILEGAADPAYKHRIEPLCVARSRPVVVYCQTGGRSALAADTLQQMGFLNVASLAGGLDLWESEDQPVAR